MSDSEDSHYSHHSEDSDTNDMDDIDIKYSNHIDELKKIKIKNHCFLKKALIKYKMQTDTSSKREKYTYEDYCRISTNEHRYYNRSWGIWQYFKYCEEILDIRKMNTRYVCSEERLEAIDFKIIYDYQMKKRDYDYNYYDKYKHLVK